MYNALSSSAIQGKEMGISNDSFVFNSSSCCNIMLRSSMLMIIIRFFVCPCTLHRY